MSTFDELIDQITKQHKPAPGQLSPSTRLLVADLESSRTEANKAVVNEIIAIAKTEAYHDFLTTSATPIIDLCLALRKAGLQEMAEAAEDGKYDA